MRMHAAHAEAMALKAAAGGEEVVGYCHKIGQARELLAALVTALELYILSPGAGDFAAQLGSVRMSGPERETATVCSE